MKNNTKNSAKLNDLKKFEIKGDAVKQVKGGSDIVIGEWMDI